MFDKITLSALLKGGDIPGTLRYLQREHKHLGHSDLLYLRRAFQTDLQGIPRAPLKLCVLRSYTVETMLPYLEVMCNIAGFEPSVYLGGYGQLFQEVLNEQSAFYQAGPEIVFILASLEDIRPDIINGHLDLPRETLMSASEAVCREIETIVAAIRKRSQAAIIVSNFIVPDYPVLGIFDASSLDSQTWVIEHLNRALAEILSSHKSCYVLDLNKLASRVGKRRFFDPRMYYMSRAPYSTDGFLAISRELLKFIKVLKGKTRKCIVLDCDNTLWGGIVGEVGLEGIALGPEYPGACFVEFQRQLLQYYRKGFVLALNSKNNENDVMQVLTTHPHQVLRPEHFSCIMVNWENKADNMHAISADLNLSTESFVYLDDDPAQCKLIEDNLPEILTVQVPKEPLDIPRLLEDVDELEILSLTEEDRERPKLYREEAKRKQLRMSAASLEQYYASLNMEMEVLSKPRGHLSRLAQMTQRTNQFNLTTHRYSEAEIQRFLESDEHQVYAFSLRDIFGDSGLVGEIILKKTSPSVYEIDTLLMSCRVIGRTAEESFVNYCLKRLKETGAAKVVARYVPTRKNSLVASFYDRMGFRLVHTGESGEKTYELDLAAAELPLSKWIAIKPVTE